MSKSIRHNASLLARDKIGRSILSPLSNYCSDGARGSKDETIAAHGKMERPRSQTCCAISKVWPPVRFGSDFVYGLHLQW